MDKSLWKQVPEQHNGSGLGRESISCCAGWLAPVWMSKQALHSPGFLGFLEKVSSDWTGMSGAWSDPQDFCSAKPRSHQSPPSKALYKLPGAWHEASPHCMVLILPANPPQPSFLELPCWGFWHQWLHEPCWPLSLTFLKYKF